MTNYEIEYTQYNGIDYDLLLPKTVDTNVVVTNNKLTSVTLYDALTELYNKAGTGGGATTPTDIKDTDVKLSTTTSSSFNGTTVASALNEILTKVDGLKDSDIALASSTNSLFTGNTVNAALSELNTKIENSSGTEFTGEISASQITSGVLPILRGGTGVSSITTFASNLVTNGYVYRVFNRTGTATESWSVNFGFRPSFIICCSESGGNAGSIFFAGKLLGSGETAVMIYDNPAKIGHYNIDITYSSTSTTFHGSTISEFTSSRWNSSLNKYTYIAFR